MFLALSAVFIAKTKILRVKESKEIETYNFDSDSTAPLLNELVHVEQLFPIPGGKVLFFSEFKLIILDPLTKKPLASIEATSDFANIKYVVPNNNFIAILTKRSITLFTKSLTKICTITEKINLKSAVWLDE